MKNLQKNFYAIIFASSSLIAGFSVQAADYPQPGNANKGAIAWANNCSRCHNIRGTRELRDDQWISTMFHMRIRAGLTGQDTRDILSFMQASNGPEAKKIKRNSTAVKAPSQATANLSGEAIYSQTCIACHGDNGKGALPGTPDFTKKDGRLTRSDEALSSDDIEKVIKYLRGNFSS
ncbi:hypothetical protein MNBD_GAMMA11-1806 [hydrothermal vent metagenome]|uniref:Cytochrome c domain-containing protein n=1 Tax=hydrothermal vent metagenome TaxID=652676 RepID=A0A3B0XDQ7_9ZZZZ